MPECTLHKYIPESQAVKAGRCQKMQFAFVYTKRRAQHCIRHSPRPQTELFRENAENSRKATKLNSCAHRMVLF